MKEITEELKIKIRSSHSGSSIKPLKWSEIYDAEEELINDMFHEKVIVEGQLSKICRGYEYIKSFRTYYKKNGHLSEKQLRQLKRLASEIAFNIYCI